jgi:hypothetical protein
VRVLWRNFLKLEQARLRSQNASTGDSIFTTGDRKLISHKQMIAARVFFIFLKFSTCCRNINVDYTLKNTSYYFTIIFPKLRKRPILVWAGSSYLTVLGGLLVGGEQLLYMTMGGGLLVRREQLHACGGEGSRWAGSSYLTVGGRVI